MRLMLKSKKPNSEQGFITMIVMMLLILGIFIFLAYQRVVNN